MPSSTATAAEVLAAVREYVEGLKPETRYIEHAYAFNRDIAEALRVDFRLAGHAWDQQAAERKFSGQVGRALDKLVAEGVLRKAGQDTAGPDGRMVYRGSVKFWTPAGRDAAVAETAERRAAEQSEADRWKVILDRLDALGVEAALARSRIWVNVSLAGWDRLLSLAEAGGDLPTHVRFAHPDAGYEAGQARAAEHLTPGEVYPLRSLEVGQSSSYVELAGIPLGQRFNSVMFEPVGSRELQEDEGT